MAKIDPVPEPIPEPIVQKLYAYCVHCAGTGQVILTNGPQPPITSSCEWCAGAGKTLFGEIGT